jgi:hypothetical protein
MLMLRARGQVLPEISATLDAEGYRPRRAASWSALAVPNIAAPRVLPRTERVMRELTADEAASIRAARTRRTSWERPMLAGPESCAPRRRVPDACRRGFGLACCLWRRAVMLRPPRTKGPTRPCTGQC